jgi:hypothetical protein
MKPQWNYGQAEFQWQTYPYKKYLQPKNGAQSFVRKSYNPETFLSVRTIYVTYWEKRTEQCIVIKTDSSRGFIKQVDSDSLPRLSV